MYTVKQLREALKHFNDDAEVVISVNAESPLPVYEVVKFTHDGRVFLETERSE